MAVRVLVACGAGIATSTVVMKKIEDFNRETELKNMSLPKTKKIKLINIPEYPKQKMVTPEIESIISIINIIK